MKYAIIALALLLCASASAQVERYRTSESGWHYEHTRDTAWCDTTWLLFDLDTAWFYIEKIDTIQADTCWECPKDRVRVQTTVDGEVRCLGFRVIDNGNLSYPTYPPQSVPDDTVWDVVATKPKITALEADTTWRAVPPGIEKAEWLRLLPIMHPKPQGIDSIVVRESWIEDTLDAIPFSIDTSSGSSWRRR